MVLDEGADRGARNAPHHLARKPAEGHCVIRRRRAGGPGWRLEREPGAASVPIKLILDGGWLGESGKSRLVRHHLGKRDVGLSVLAKFRPDLGNFVGVANKSALDTQRHGYGNDSLGA